MMKVKRGKRQEFAEFCAQHILDECDQHTGGTYLTEAFDSMFDLLFEGYEDGSSFTLEKDPEE